MSYRLGELPSIENLQCFVAAAEHLNFRRAAEQLSLTPAAFGQRIKQLEEQLEQTLFKRTTRQVELSPEGRALLEHAHGILRQAGACQRIVHHPGRQPARFTLGTRFELGL